MMEWQNILAIVLFSLLTLFLIIKRKDFVFQGKFPFLYAGLLRTRWGLGLMEFLGIRMGNIIRPLATVGIVIGFLGMGVIVFEVLKSAFLMIALPDQAPSVQLVLPVQAKGVFYVPPVFWILSIFVVAIIHEFAHGVVARGYNMRVKSSGIAFLGVLIPIIPAAFVEPDEKQLEQRPKKQQLAVFAAGPFSNIIFSALLILLLGLPLQIPGFSSVLHYTTVVDLPELEDFLTDLTPIQITAVNETSPAARAGLTVGTTILSINEVSTESGSIGEALIGLKPGDTLRLTDSSGRDYSVILGSHPLNNDLPYVGIGFEPQERVLTQAAVVRYGRPLAEFLKFLVEFAIWAIFLSLGIGLFNLVPIGPIDGGRMLLASLRHFFSEARAYAIWKNISGALLILIVVNVLAGFVL